MDEYQSHGVKLYLYAWRNVECHSSDSVDGIKLLKKSYTLSLILVVLTKVETPMISQFVSWVSYTNLRWGGIIIEWMLLGSHIVMSVVMVHWYLAWRSCLHGRQRGLNSALFGAYVFFARSPGTDRKRCSLKRRLCAIAVSGWSWRWQCKSRTGILRQ